MLCALRPSLVRTLLLSSKHHYQSILTSIAFRQKHSHMKRGINPWQYRRMNTVPNDIVTEEGWHSLIDGHKVYTKIWKSPDTPKARLIVLHGFSDHCNDFEPLFPLLAAKGIEIFGVDQRGWGRSVKSAKERGRTGGSDQVLLDITSYVRRYLPSFPKHSSTRPDNVPLFLFGHSMGGAEVIYHASKFPSSDVRGYIASASWIKLGREMQPSTLR